MANGVFAVPQRVRPEEVLAAAAHRFAQGVGEAIRYPRKCKARSTGINLQLDRLVVLPTPAYCP